MSLAIAPSVTCHLVGMGQIAVFSPPETARAVLGSCVGVTLFDDLTQIAALAHVVLPKSEGRPAPSPGKFADTAIASMRQSLLQRGANPKRIQAKIAGGANMFVGKGPFQIGVQNIEAVRAALASFSIRLLAEHLGGAQGRRVTFDHRQNKLVVEVSGQPAVYL
jgi:chemotaxis protein CheD